VSDHSDKKALLTVLFALQRLPASVQATALADRDFVARYQIPVSPLPMIFQDSIKISRDALFAAFDKAGDGSVVEFSVMELDKPVVLNVRIADDGAGIVEAGGRGTRIVNAGLWHRDPQRRRQILEKMLLRCTLASRYATEVREIVSTEPFTEELFVAASDLLNATPEEFSIQLASKLSRPSLGELDFLPSDPRYWENLLPLPSSAQSLAEFVGAELRDARNLRMAENSVEAMATISLQFAGQETVPHDWFNGQTAENVIAYVEGLLGFEDHFALVAAFEICAHRASQDDRFVLLGAQLLDRLFGDTPRMLDRCTLFAAMFVLATARVSMLPRFREAPVFWKRLAAAAHASLVVRAFENRPPPQDIFSWAMRQHQEHFRTAVYAEMGNSPRWRPEWVEAESLAGDCYGRVLQCLVYLGDSSIPESWQSAIQRAGDWISELDAVLPAHLPSLTQGERPTQAVPLGKEWQERRDEFLGALRDNPNRDNLIRFANIVEITGVEPDARELVFAAAKRALIESGADPTMYGPVALVSARMAALSRDVSLAQLVADHLSFAAQARPQDISVPDNLFRLLECAAADSDPAHARETLAKRLENLAAMIPADNHANRLARALRSLRRVHEPLNELLAGAENLARLAATQANLGPTDSPT
jgi:hypothetical protein